MLNTCPKHCKAFEPNYLSSVWEKNPNPVTCANSSFEYDTCPYLVERTVLFSRVDAFILMVFFVFKSILKHNFDVPVNFFFVAMIVTGLLSIIGNMAQLLNMPILAEAVVIVMPSCYTFVAATIITLVMMRNM
jgi:ABC-type multidrug transport system permease subunit